MLLESMKKGVSKIVIQILAVLLIASFALWGVGDMVGIISNPDEVAKVGNSRISQREFQEQFRRTLDQARQTMGDIDAESAQALGLDDIALDSLLSQRLLLMQANDLGVLIGDDQVAESIRTNPTFRNSLGEFDRAAFQSILANNGLTEAAYVASIRQDLQRQYLGEIVEGAVAPPSLLTETIYRHRNEARSVEFLRIDRSSMKAPPTPAESELDTYLKDNPEEFMTPEYRKVTLLHLDPEEVARELSPSAERIQEEYEGRLDSLEIPERRDLEQILSGSEETARRLHATVTEGKDLAEVASSDDTGSQYVKLGSVTRRDLPTAIADAAFILPEGGITSPVKSPLGWHILRVNKIEPGRTPPLSEVEDEIRNDLARELALDDLVRRANKVEDAQSGGASLEETALEGGTRAIVLDPVNARGMLESGGSENRLPDDRRFLETVFAAETGETSDLLETSEGGYFMVRVDQIIDSRLPALEQVREAVVTAWKTDQRNQMAESEAKKILERARTGQPLKQLASSERLKFSEGGPSTRIPAEGSDIPPEMLEPMFTAKEREPFLAELSDGYAVARVTQVTQATVDRESDQYKGLSQALTAAMSNDLVGEYTRSLRQDYDVVINRQALDAFFAARQ